MIAITDRLSLRKISPKVILLDPNNPRLLARIGGGKEVSEEAIANPKIQQKTRDEMMEPGIGVSDLRDSMVQVGFLPMDKIVVRKLSSGDFVVVEGNRRVTALKLILDELDQQTLDLEPAVRATVESIEVLELDTSGVEARQIQLVLQGVRHVSGVKSWGPYQQAEVVVTFRSMGFDTKEIGQSLGLKPQDVNRLRRAYSALRQMAENDEYGSYAVPELFSYFEEAHRRPAIREWLVWDDTQGAFTNATNLDLFYSWITPSDAQGGAKKIGRAIDVRDLEEIIGSHNALEALKAPETTLKEALQHVVPATSFKWQEAVADAVKALNQMAAADLENMNDTDAKLLFELREVINKRLKMSGISH